MHVLDCLLGDLSKGLCGAEIANETKLLSGSLYPILHRLERLGWVTAKLEDVDPKAVGRPRRRFYFLTAEARPIALEALVERGFYEVAPVFEQGGVHGNV